MPGIDAELDPEALHQYLTFLWVPDPADHVPRNFQAARGSLRDLSRRSTRVTKYWDLTFPPADAAYTGSEGELAEEIRERFRRSVEGADGQ